MWVWPTFIVRCNHFLPILILFPKRRDFQLSNGAHNITHNILIHLKFGQNRGKKEAELKTGLFSAVIKILKNTCRID